MARIIQTKEQTEALKNVKNDLKTLKNINCFIEQASTDETEVITISANFKGAALKIPLDKRIALGLLDKEKRKLQKDISAAASRFCIMLDDSDKAILEQ